MMYEFEFEEITCCWDCPIYNGNYCTCNLDIEDLHGNDLTFLGEGRPDFCKLEEHDETR